MTPQRKANELYNSAYQLYPTPTNIEELAQVNREIYKLNINVCKIMESIGHPLLWRKTKEIIQKQISK
jgi:hypothetical protein